MHSALLVSCGTTRVMIDCGSDWLEELGSISPDAIVITHAHPDHAFGLKEGAPCPVYATADSWHALKRMPVRSRELVNPGTSFSIGQISFRAFPVVHSVIAPAVGYRITSGATSLFYVPDVLRIPDSRDALGGIDLYIGDGARLKHPIVRGKGDRACGHASIHQQLSWCEEAGVTRAIFTHCGTPIITADELEAAAALQALASPLSIEATFARDGQEIRLSRRVYAAVH